MSRLEQLQKLAAVSPDDPMAHYAVGLELNNQERWEEAIAAFDAALQADENYSAAYFHQGKAQIKAHQPDAARETLTKGIEVANGAGDWKTAREMTELRDMIA
jgi:tetratricopeptide (TPR) repeat protein